MVADHQNGKAGIIQPLAADAPISRTQGAQQQACQPPPYIRLSRAFMTKLGLWFPKQQVRCADWG